MACGMPDDATGMEGIQTALRLTFPGDADAVRLGLEAMRDSPLLRALPEADRGTAEIVLAEALNNIVEHAYAQHAGEIEVCLHRQPFGLTCQIIDSGLPMPDGTPPAGALPPLCEITDLPEGGWGWFLIRSLSQDLTYQREAGRNLLSFRLKGEQSATAEGIVSN